MMLTLSALVPDTVCTDPPERVSCMPKGSRERKSTKERLANSPDADVYVISKKAQSSLYEESVGFRGLGLTIVTPDC